MVTIKNSVFGLPAGALLLAGVMGCASAPPPTDQMAEARLAVRQVQDSPAQDNAPAELRQARQKLEAAQREMDAENYVQARRLAEQAVVDAQFADVKSDEVISTTSLQSLETTVDALENETLELNR
jgi:hypothetical protein